MKSIATPTSDTAEDQADHDCGDQATADSGSSMVKMMSDLKELSSADYTFALGQHTCPVSGEILGTMDAPEKVDVNGKSVWICCGGCKAKLLAVPEKYLVKLK